MRKKTSCFALAAAVILLSACGKSGAETAGTTAAAAAESTAAAVTAESTAATVATESTAAAETEAAETETETETKEEAAETAETEKETVAAAETEAAEAAEAAGAAEDSAEGFVVLAEAVPDVILEIRYYSTYNFVGDRIDGYNEPCALITKEAAEALKGAAEDAKEQGYMLKIYDAYRPQSAVDNFIAWAEDTGDTRMKPYFYPELDKSVLFDQGYIAEKSGHSRGSTLDLTLFDMDTEKEADMGGTFDYFGELSHPDYTGDLTEEQIANRNKLRDIMVENGFRPLDTEWWHFTLENEPYPDTYFTFPVEHDSVARQ